MRAAPHLAERPAPGVLAAALAALAGLAVWDVTGHTVEWWAIVLAASVAAGSAFILDARSTARFGRGAVAAYEWTPLLRAAARRYTLRSCFVIQAAAEACLVAAAPCLVAAAPCLVAAAPWLLPSMPAHYALAGLAVAVSVMHCCGWVCNSRLLGARAHG